MECQICLIEVEGEQWGIIPVEVKELDENPDNDWVDFVHDYVAFVVHPYCMNEAVECYTQELGIYRMLILRRQRMVRVYTYEEVEQYFDQDTYGDLLDLLRDMINGQYTIDSVRLDIGEYTEDLEYTIKKLEDIDYE